MKKWIYDFFLFLCIIWFQVVTLLNKSKLTVIGYLKIKNRLKIGKIYRFSNNGRYYKYLRDSFFNEGNKTFDNGQFAIQIPGGVIHLSKVQIGMIEFTEV